MMTIETLREFEELTCGINVYDDADNTYKILIRQVFNSIPIEEQPKFVQCIRQLVTDDMDSLDRYIVVNAISDPSHELRESLVESIKEVARGMNGHDKAMAITTLADLPVEIWPRFVQRMKAFASIKVPTMSKLDFIKTMRFPWPWVE